MSKARRRVAEINREVENHKVWGKANQTFREFERNLQGDKYFVSEGIEDDCSGYNDDLYLSDYFGYDNDIYDEAFIDEYSHYVADLSFDDE